MLALSVARQQGPVLVWSLSVQHDIALRLIESLEKGGNRPEIGEIQGVIEECKAAIKDPDASRREKLDAIKLWKDLQKQVDEGTPAQSLTAECIDFLGSINVKVPR